MIKYELQKDTGILVLEPEGPLEASDFKKISDDIDTYIVNQGALTGVLIYTESFPGWEDFQAMLSHFQFVKNNSADIWRVAAVTDSTFLTIMPQIVDFFISADVRHFDYDKRDEAMHWLTENLSRSE
jgi:hypothetical protein